MNPSGTPVHSSKDLGLLARSARLRAHLSQREVAGLSGVGLRFVSDLENGKPTLRLDKVLTVLSALGVALIVTDRPRKAALPARFSANLRRLERRSGQSEAKANLMGIHAACRAFRAKAGRYPRSLHEGGWSADGTSQYLHLLNPRETVGGESSPDRRRLAGLARRTLRELGLRVGGRKNTFLAAAVTFREDGEETGSAGIEIDVWTIDASRTLVNHTPDYADRD